VEAKRTCHPARFHHPLARAYNLTTRTGRTLTAASTPARWPFEKFFGAARNIEEVGQPDILETALVEPLPDGRVIFEEFKGTETWSSS
jgi:transcription termination factor Rho